jgi:hypothetical protein
LIHSQVLKTTAQKGQGVNDDSFVYGSNVVDFDSDSDFDFENADSQQPDRLSFTCAYPDKRVDKDVVSEYHCLSLRKGFVLRIAFPLPITDRTTGASLGKQPGP